ncbi:hypothetical protein TGPRC2_238870 [Toxoplasma gondii TgCatPRC2]|uniref:Uncharacterized protein n=3 Tax=Toxoplasma gondii TaxID=5811 RepID=B6KGD9_TOXGV|nr:hypothetical protein TGME49_238870 [Toxoplasma gondii ME49]EPT30827.1 hypothetical protein TGME49_238870 [Toxoplasma gondii ME49]ESS31306.1 hypothetical protein TGVEG_238870 [Toxoplasma gondii VEG]KYK66253.1 hypothetical protein TGPRC2_238870 [Toxoplasma gondii TgCatPRC2]CEL73272.1 TPA: hypothetical protein BN1205_092750 [Toxoplasma gondii VEG]|eukprot:XP_018637685.1 hypothetical protein TGME49_238870 [Toxoplasma gondii ME49]
MRPSSSEERPSVSPTASAASSAPFALSAADRRLLLLSSATVISQRTPSHLSRPEIVEFFSRFGSLHGPGDGLAFPSDRRDKRLLIRFRHLQDALRCLKAQGLPLERRGGEEERESEAKKAERRSDEFNALSAAPGDTAWSHPLQLSREDKIKLSALRGNARAMQLLHSEGTLQRLRGGEKSEKEQEAPGRAGDSRLSEDQKRGRGGLATRPGAHSQSLFAEDSERVSGGDRGREKHPTHGRIADDSSVEEPPAERDAFFDSRSSIPSGGGHGTDRRSVQRDEKAERQRAASGDTGTSEREGRRTDSPLRDLLSGALVADQLKQTEGWRSGSLVSDPRRAGALGETGGAFGFHEKTFARARDEAGRLGETLRADRDGEDGAQEDENTKAARLSAEKAFTRRRAEATHSLMISSLAGFMFNPENPYDNYLIPALPRPAPAVPTHTSSASPPM